MAVIMFLCMLKSYIEVSSWLSFYETCGTEVDMKTKYSFSLHSYHKNIVMAQEFIQAAHNLPLTAICVNSIYYIFHMCADRSVMYCVYESVLIILY